MYIKKLFIKKTPPNYKILIFIFVLNWHAIYFFISIFKL
jgi:hypothetical protein